MSSSSSADLGPYRIVRSIATGGMAEIFLARHRGLEGVERTVVIKKILPEYANDAEFVTMFLDEARLLAALSHPNIAQVFDLGRMDGSFFLAMEYVRGPVLGRLLSKARERGERLPRREALGIGLAIAEALHYVHQRRDEVGRPLDIVHRDLNPANVLVSWDGAVKLIDFGIAKAATKVYETRTGVIKGTYGYIAPEQLAGTIKVDRRADVFALGIVLYEMIVGQHPFDVSNEPNLIDRILEARYERPRAIDASIPRDLDRLIASCLSPHPEGRPEHMESLIEQLAEHLGQQGMVPTTVGIAKLVRRLVPDNEGPSPLRPLTSPHVKRPLGNVIGGTRELPMLPQDATREVRSPPTGAAFSENLSGLDEGWNDATLAFDDREPLDAGLPDKLSLPAELSLSANLSMPLLEPHESPDPGPDDDSPTRLVAISDAESKRRHDVAPPKLMSQSESTYVPRPAARAPKRVPTVALFGVALVAMLVVAGLTFALIHALTTAPEDAATTELAQTSTLAQTSERSLRVVSEPSGAQVFVDGASVEGETPITVTLPAGTGQVWIRVSHAGFADSEREVRASVGEARFRLSPAR